MLVSFIATLLFSSLYPVLSFYSSIQLRPVGMDLGMKVVWIISAYDPNPNYADMEKSF
jgi:hypothetical protein